LALGSLAAFRHLPVVVLGVLVLQFCCVMRLCGFL
jgi:hypothetical protein